MRWSLIRNALFALASSLLLAVSLNVGEAQARASCPDKTCASTTRYTCKALSSAKCLGGHWCGLECCADDCNET
jgi:hypothetical protein